MVHKHGHRIGFGFLSCDENDDDDDGIAFDLGLRCW